MRHKTQRARDRCLAGTAQARRPRDGRHAGRRRRPRYGLEIIRHLDDERDLSLPEGTIYPLLSRLTRDGFVLGEWRPTEPHPRKYYTLTPRGRRRLTEMCGAWRAFAGKMNKLIAEAVE